jgi:tetrahydromethanopterin S-methyltransferase subunit A
LSEKGRPDIMEDLKELLVKAEKISKIEKCETCQCFYDVLMEMREVLEKGNGNKELKRRLNEIIEKAKISHDCLGCDPCLPVPISNLLHEIGGGKIRQARICGTVCKPILVSIRSKATSWPVEQGEYVLGLPDAPVAICTLGSDEIPEKIAGSLGKELFAIAGKTYTENIGLEKIVKNTISNSHIRFLIVCGKDTRGHMAGQSLLSLIRKGVSQDKRIMGSKGQRAVLRNLSYAEIQHFREQVHLIDLIGVEDLKRIEAEARECKRRNPGRFDRSLDVRTAPTIEAKSPTGLVLDPSGFFIIYPKKNENRVYLEHYKEDGTLNEIIYGEDPVFIASTAIERSLVSRLDHAAYLGRELERAYQSMVQGYSYIQDSAPCHEGKELD